jgi:CelD/BcsL family acetyltransferase involved in cellulose biosynthesis
MTITIRCFDSLDAVADQSSTWDRLAGGVPFRSFAWLATWWRHYGAPARESAGPRLLVAAAYDPTGRIVGLAPWYLDRSAVRGRVIGFLGTGEVCSDYLGLLCEPGCEVPVADALAGWLLAGNRDGGRSASDNKTRPGDAETAAPGPPIGLCPPWDLLDLEGYAAGDPAVERLIERLGELGCVACRREAPSLWRLALPRTWEQYLERLSKNQRKRMRREAKRMLDSGHMQVSTVERIDELDEALRWLIDLHQQRRRALGEPGCFASPRFTAFHRDATRAMLAQGQLGLHLLRMGDSVLAAEYQLVGGGVVYAYQAGWDVERADLGPGNLITLATLRRAVEQGYTALDFLRGDEPYKRTWRAEPRPSGRTLLVPPRAGPRLRHGILEAGRNLRRWAFPPAAAEEPEPA